MRLNQEDLKRIEELGLTEEVVRSQIDQFKNGFESVELESPATIGNGIVQIEDRIEKHIQQYDQSDVEVVKFVPASGAATRMFKVLFQFLEAKKLDKNESLIHQFFDEISEFAFYEELNMLYHEESGVEISADLPINEKARVVKLLLNNSGLNYGNLPKGLLKFHTYENEVKTPAQEHLAEGIAYAEKKGQINIHFTVSPSHVGLFKQHVEEAIQSAKTNSKIKVSFSSQKSSTDTIAVDLYDDPFRSDNGSILFRPAGHGALLENLNELQADIVFIKNIDNVVPDRLKDETIRYKKAIAGILIDFQERTFDLLNRADQGEEILKPGIKLLSQMGWRGEYTEEEVIKLLNRPIRVCGMVKNEGEPGGGPFWVSTSQGKSLQIVESAQIDDTNETQVEIFNSSTHFNPVDVVCGIKDYKGESFDLLKFRDSNLGFISQKSHQGRKLKAMELPGLWNGSMAFWNTIFVEVPLITFNPVKTVMDLLKENHR